MITGNANLESSLVDNWSDVESELVEALGPQIKWACCILLKEICFHRPDLRDTGNTQENTETNGNMVPNFWIHSSLMTIWGCLLYTDKDPSTIIVLPLDTNIISERS